MMVRRVLASYTDTRVTVRLSSTLGPNHHAREMVYELEIAHEGEGFTNVRGWPKSGRMVAWDEFRAAVHAELNDRVAVVRSEL